MLVSYDKEVLHVMGTPCAYISQHVKKKSYKYRTDYGCYADVFSHCTERLSPLGQAKEE